MLSPLSQAVRHGVLAFSLGVICSVALWTSSPATGFSSLGQEWDSDGTNQCGNTTAMTPLLTYRPCNILFSYDSSITSRGWDAVVRGGAYNWCYHSDPYQGNHSDFCWEDGTYIGGNIGAYVSAGDMGQNADGSWVAGTDSNVATQTQWSVITHNNTISYADVQLNTNSKIPWYVNANSSYTVPASSFDLQTTVSHEMGHALGLNHPQHDDYGSTDPVMSCVQHLGMYNHTSTDDAHGQLWLYGGENSAWGSPQASPC